MPNDRCGYTHHANRYPDSGALTCWRPTYEEYDRCLWHADEGAKSPEALEDYGPEPGERLDGAVLRGVLLEDQDWLAETTLVGVDFEAANLEGADLRGSDLRGASFDDAHARATNFEETNLEDASFDSTKLQGASFRSAQLNDTEFSGSRISRETGFDDVVGYEQQLEEATDPDEREELFDAATWVYRRLQDLSRRNALFGNVEHYFLREKAVRRRFAWQQREYIHALRAEGSRWLIGYGRNPWRIVAISGLVVGLCALLFPFLGTLQDTAGQESVRYALELPPQGSVDRTIAVFGKSLYFSVVTFATLGYGDVQPVGTAIRALAGIESLLGFGLVALLISVLLGRGSWL